MAEQFPEEIGKYKVSGIIAKGGMGVVYKAVHPSLKRQVVIKKMTARKNSINIERFKREAQILLDLQCPNIVHLFDYFQEGGYRYMVEELVDGLALDKLLRKQTILSPQIALLILQDCCFALKYAHSKDIVHRDIKPGNILISKRAEIKLADFGIATDTAKGDDITQSGVALGTPAYMPPEQFENSASVDQRADIYALGIMLYEMVTGTKPYPGTLSVETLNTIKKGKYISPRKIDKTIPWCVCHLIKKMLKPKPKHRFQSINPILKKVKSYLKHYDVHALRVQLAKLVISPKPLKEEPYIRKDIKKRNITISVSLSVLFIAFFAFSWMKGWIHKTVLRAFYSPVTVEMEMPVTSAEGSFLPASVFFYENDGNKIPNVIDVLNGKTCRRTFNEIQESSNSKKNILNKKYKSPPVYLRPGNYRAKIVIGPYIYWKSFEVSGKDLNIKYDFLKNMKRTVKVMPHAYNSKTGEEITSSVKVYVLSEKNAWILLEDYPPEKLTGGKIYQFKFVADGCSQEQFGLKLDWYQDELFIASNLTPVEF